MSVMSVVTMMAMVTVMAMMMNVVAVMVMAVVRRMRGCEGGREGDGRGQRQSRDKLLQHIFPP